MALDLRTAGWALLGAGLLAGCAGDGAEVEGPGGAARALFELARAGDPSDERLGEIAELDPADDIRRAELLDALESVPRSGDLRILAVEQPMTPGDAFVDLEIDLPGGGIARYSLRLGAAEASSWRVTWLQGPGVEWPGSGSRRDDGLSSSAPPGDGR